MTLTIFGALSALVGTWLALGADGGGVPREYLANSPFASFAVPGLILGVVVGGTQAAAAVALLQQKRIALLLSAIAGFGMVVWIFAELSMIRQYSWLQTMYFVHGVMELIFVFALLGIVPAIAHPWHSSGTTTADV